MSSPYLQNLYNAVSQHIIKNSNKAVYCIDDHDNTPSSLVCFVQNLFVKISTSLGITALVAYLVHAIFLNCSVTYRGWLFENWFSLIAFLETLFEGTVEVDTNSHSKNNSAQYWFTSSDVDPPEEALTSLKHHSL